MTQKQITVFGGTGTQGGGVVRNLLKDGSWKVRAVTRNTSSDAAKAIEKLGASVVAADMDKPDTLVAACEGSQAVFACTNFWEHLGRGLDANAAGEKELQQAIDMAKAAAATSTLEHYIWSTIGTAEGATNGKFPVPHIDYKAKADEYIKSELPELAKKTTFMWVGYYATNLVYLPLLQPTKLATAGRYVQLLPCPGSVKIANAGDPASNVGIYVRAILANPDKTLPGRYTSVQDGALSMDEYLAIWNKVTGQQAVTVEVTLAAYETLFGSFGKELNMQFQFCNEVPDWRIPGMVTAEELGIEGFVSVEQTFKNLYESGAVPMPA